MAIGFTTCSLIVVLMIGLTCIESLFGEEQGVHHVTFVKEHLHDPFGGPLLGFIAIEDAAAILGTEIRTHTICLGRIVNLEKEFAKRFVGDLLWVEFHDDSLHMMSLVVTHIGIGGESLLATRIAGQRVEHPLLSRELVLCAPKATTGKDPHFEMGGGGRSLIEIYLRASFYGRCHHPWRLAMLGLEIGIGLPSGIVVFQVVVFHLQGDGVLAFLQLFGDINLGGSL